MAKRTGFFLDLDTYAPIEGMGDSQLGQLLRAMYRWHRGEEVCFSDALAELAFKFFRVSFERDRQAQESLAAKRREAAEKRWQKKAPAVVSEAAPLVDPAPAQATPPAPVQGMLELSPAPNPAAASAPDVVQAEPAVEDAPAREALPSAAPSAPSAPSVPSAPLSAAPSSLADTNASINSGVNANAAPLPLTRLPQDPDPGDPNLADMEFQQVLDAYPEGHTAPSGEAALIWKHLKMQRKLPGLPRILQAIADWSASEEWTKDCGQYIPKLSNFLRHHWWEDKPRPVLTGEEMIQAEARRIAASLS